MASPLANGHPATPPASEPASRPPQPPAEQNLPDVPLTSAQDSGDSKRPRDARLIHLVLSSLGIQSYQERVPLQLLDFAYRYTSSVLSDSLRLSADGYADQRNAGRCRGAAAEAGGEGITVTSLRQAIASRQGYTFAGHLPKEFMLDQATERNRVTLPRVERGWGVQLPAEKFCLTGAGWDLKDEWDSEEEVVAEEATNGTANGTVRRPASGGSKPDEPMDGLEGAMDEDEDDDEEGGGRMEDVFGEEGGDVDMAQS